MIQIIGAGAIGCLWLAKLQQSGHTCHIVSRAKHITKTLTLTELDGHTKKIPISHSQQLLNSTAIQQSSLILVCVKAQHVLNALLMQQQFISPSQPIILMHNGYGCAEEVQQYFPDNAIISATTSNASLLNGTFNITHTGSGPTFFGAFNNKANALSELIQPLTDVLPEAFWTQNIQQKCWVKLAINAVINPLTAINQIKNGQLSDPKYVELIDLLIEEIFQISQAESIDMDINKLRDTVMLVITSTAENYSSMNRDVFHQRETEIDFINGYLLKKAKLHNIKAPKLNAYYQQIKSLL